MPTAAEVLLVGIPAAYNPYSRKWIVVIVFRLAQAVKPQHTLVILKLRILASERGRYSARHIKQRRAVLTVLLIRGYEGCDADAMLSR